MPGPLTEVELGEFSRIISRTRLLHKGDYLYRVGKPFEGLYAVYSSFFKKFSVTENGTEQVAGIYFPGEILGLHAIYSGAHPFNVVALNTGLSCFIPYTEYQKLVIRYPKLDHHMYWLLSLELMKARFLAAEMSALEKVATLLLTMSHRFPERGYAPQEFLLPMPNSDIASMLRLAAETVSRIFTKLEAANIAAIRHRHVRILDMKKLIQTCPQDLDLVDDRPFWRPVTSQHP